MMAMAIAMTTAPIMTWWGKRLERLPPCSWCSQGWAASSDPNRAQPCPPMLRSQKPGCSEHWCFRNGVSLLLTMITCVSGSLASSSRKRIMTPKTSSLEVFAGSHLQEGWSIIIMWSIPIIIMNCSVNYNQRETIMVFRRGTCWLWTPTLSCPWHPWKTNIFTFLDFELVLIFILPPFQFHIKKTCKIKTWMLCCAPVRKNRDDSNGKGVPG